MFAKLAVLIVALGACACTLLALRQSRLQAASEITQAQIRINGLDDRLYTLRAEIATRLAPHELERLTQGIGPLKPIIPGEPLPIVREEGKAAEGEGAVGAGAASPKGGAKKDGKKDGKQETKSKFATPARTATYAHGEAKGREER